MIRAAAVAAMVLIGTAAVAQTVKGFQESRESNPPTRIPEIQADTDPMRRQPDPAEGTPAAKALSEPAAGDRNSRCRVRRADTDTGFVVVCEEAD